MKVSLQDFEQPVKEIVEWVVKEIPKQTLMLEGQCLLLHELVKKLEQGKARLTKGDFIDRLAGEIHFRIDTIIGPLIADVSDEDEKAIQEHKLRRHLLNMIKMELLLITSHKTQKKWLAVLKYCGFTSAGILAGIALAKILRNGEDAEKAEKRLKKDKK